jgi:methionyl-tRNA formyltransferase
MKIGVISGAEICEPVLYYLASQKATISLFYAGLPGAETTKQMVAFCETYHIPIVIETTRDHVYEWVRNDQADVVFIMGYGRILNVTRLDPLTSGVFNIHFGALPNYRGPSPVFWQLTNGEKNIEVCIHRITNKADAGAIVWRKSIPNEEFHTYSFINQYLSNITVEGVDFILNCLLNSNKLKEFPQDETKARYFSRPVLKDILINWSAMNAAAIFNLCRACNSWNRGAITSYKGLELKILDVITGTTQHNKEPGTIISIENNLEISCVDGSCSIHFMNLNGLFFPGRYAKHLGFAVGHRLGI